MKALLTVFLGTVALLNTGVFCGNVLEELQGKTETRVWKVLLHFACTEALWFWFACLVFENTTK